MYAFTLAEVMGKQTGSSVEIIPFSSSIFYDFTPMQCFLSRLPRAGSSGGSGSIVPLIICSVVIFIDGIMTFLIQCMWPMIVIGDFGRCFCMAMVVNTVQPPNQSFAMAFIQVGVGMIPTHACR